MKEHTRKEKLTTVDEPIEVYMKQFSSQEEADRYNMIENLQKSDMEKFRLFCKMLRLEQTYKKAKVYDYNSLK
jgi:hypothetical protein